VGPSDLAERSLAARSGGSGSPAIVTAGDGGQGTGSPPPPS